MNKYFTKKFIFLFLCIINILPIISGFVFINLFAVNVPYHDQFGVELPKIIHFNEGNLTLSDFLTLNNDHRPIFVHILTFIILSISKFNVILEANIGYLLHVLAFIMIWIIFKNEIPGLRPSSLYIFPVTLFFFNFYLISAYLWGILISSALCLLAMICMVYCINKCDGLDKLFIAALFCAIVGTFSWTAGLFLWPAGLFQLWISYKNRKNILMVLWIVSCIILVIFDYLILGFRTTGVHGYEGYSAYITAFLHYPIQKGICFTEALGSNIVHDIAGAFGFGVLIIILFIFVLYLNRNQIRSPDTILWLTVSLYAAMVLFALVLSRSGDGGVFGPANNIVFLPAVRHYPSIFIIIIGLYGLITSSFARDLQTDSGITKNIDEKLACKPWNSKFAIDCALFGFVVAMLLSGFILNSQIGIVHGVLWAEENTKDYNILKNYHTASANDLQKLYTDRQTVSKLEQYNLSVFSSSSSGFYPNWMPESLRKRILNSEYIKTVYLS